MKMSRKYSGFLMLFILSIGISGCVGIRGVRYDPPIPDKNYYEVKFKLYICSWEEFQEIVKFYYDKLQPGTAGLTIRRINGEKIVILPRRKDGTIDLKSLGDGSFYTIDSETLGHEIFYHVIHDIDH